MAPTPARVRVSDDGLTAHLEPSAPGEPVPSREQVLAALAAAGVVHGVVEAKLDAALAQLAQVAKPVEVARGTPPQAGRNGSFELLLDAHGAQRSGAAIDFHEKRRFHSVRCGERVAVRKTPLEGKPGRGVDGREIAPPPVKDVPFSIGENVQLVEEPGGRTLVKATVDGAAVVASGNRVSVLEQLRIEGDVDYSVGNIETAGSVLIAGSVRSSFQVKAARDVVVGRTIEDAIVEAGGSVSVGQGILGGEFGHVKAGRDVSVHHAQNARIECGGDVVLGDSDMNSTILAGGTLRALDRRGRLCGGRYQALLGVSARELGSALGVPTHVHVGFDVHLERALNDARRALRELEAAEELEALAAGHEALTRDRAAEIRRCLRERAEKREAVAALEEERARFEARFHAESAPGVTVLKAVYAGVTIEIRGGRCDVSDELGPRRFVLDPESGTLLVE